MNYAGTLLEITDKRITEILNSESAIPLGDKTYYISNDGNDSEDGLSPECAWATLTKLNETSISSGSSVLFERGGLWRGQLQAKAGVSYSAYGKGSKPRLYASPENALDWKETGIPNIYVYGKTVTEDVGTIVFDGGIKCAIKTVIRRAENGSLLDDRTDFKQDLHFYHDLKSGKIYMFSESGNPADRFGEIELNVKHHVITTEKNDITIDNLCVKYGGSHGIGSGTISGLKVTNCEFGWIGGSIQESDWSNPPRYGNAVEIYGGCDGYIVDNCYFYQIYDAAVTHQVDSTGRVVKMLNIAYTNNVMEYCNYSIEYFLTGLCDGSESIMENVYIGGNLMRYAGYGLCEQRPDKGQAAHIKSWNSVNPAINFRIENNVMAYSSDNLTHIHAAEPSSFPIMKDNIMIE